jgi:hypothetical protein
MSIERLPSQGVTEGNKTYNKYASLQAAGAALAIPLLEEAARKIELGQLDRPIVMADYGSSQGKNSLAPMRAAIVAIRARVGTDRQILVFHTDQPSNDFNVLFETIDGDPNSYATDEPNVFPYAIGRSFYGNVLPARYVHLGWSAYAAVWLSRVPMTIPGHFIAPRSTGAARAAFERQGARDWETFLSLRASEMQDESRLVVVLPAVDEGGHWGLTDLMDHANAALGDMTDAGEISHDERARMTLAAYPRRKQELLAPFERDRPFHGLVVEHCAISALDHPAWIAYERTGNREILAADLTLFFRSTFMPSLATALDPHGGDQRRRAFGNQLECRIKRRLKDEPVAAVQHFVATIVVAKRARREERGVTTAKVC